MRVALLLTVAISCGGSQESISTEVDSGVLRVDAGVSSADASGSELVLSPKTLQYFSLPIGSLRYAVSGQEPGSGLCVSVIWYLSTIGSEEVSLCGTDSDLVPYVVIAPATPLKPQDGTGPQYGTALCEIWDYGSEVEVLDVQGCANFKTSDLPLTGSADLVVTVDSPLLSGPVTIKSQ